MSKKLNILFLMADQLPASALPSGGNSIVYSPHIDSLSENGVTFDNCYCASPLCAPSRFSLMAGALPSRINAWDNACEFSSETPTIAHYLRNEGYRTTLAGKMHFCGPDQLHGFEERLTTDIYPADFGWTPDWKNPNVRPDWYHNQLSVLQAGPCIRSNQLDFDDEVTYAARRHIFDLARSNDERPFFLTVSWTHPHDPYAALPRLMNRYKENDIPLPKTRAESVFLDPHSARLRSVCDLDRYLITDDHVRRARHAYYANISYVDEQIGILLSALNETGQAENTVIVFTADHGDMLGERGLWYKMNWFEDSCRVPLIISAPGTFKSHRVSAPVSSLDLLPTFLGIAKEGANSSFAAPKDGQTLLPELSGRETKGRLVTGEYCGEGAISPIIMLRQDQWKFVMAPGDPDQLYNLENDPRELNNLAGSIEFSLIVQYFQNKALSHWNVETIRSRVLESQSRRQFIHRANSKGLYHSWDYQPHVDASTRYMRNHLVLDDLEWRSRLPRALPIDEK